MGQRYIDQDGNVIEVIEQDMRPRFICTKNGRGRASFLLDTLSRFYLPIPADQPTPQFPPPQYDEISGSVILARMTQVCRRCGDDVFNTLACVLTDDKPYIHFECAVLPPDYKIIAFDAAYDLLLRMGVPNVWMKQ